jgi:hypothetical protein
MREVQEAQEPQDIFWNTQDLLYHRHRSVQHWKLQWEVAEQADHQVEVHRVEQTEKARQVFQVDEAVTQDHNHIQDQAAEAAEPLSY